MAVTYLDNLPVKWSPEDESCDYDSRPYCQLVNRNDTTTVVIRGDDSCTSTDLVAGNLETEFAAFNSWENYNPGWLAKSVGGFTDYYWMRAIGSNQAVELRLATTFNTGYYKIVFTIGYGDTTNAGFVKKTELTGTLSVGYSVTLASTTANIETFDTVGTKTVYARISTASLTEKIRFTPSANFDGTISEVSVYKVNDYYTLSVYDSNGTWKGFVASDASHQDYFRFSLTWSSISLADGCYKLGVLSGCVNTDLIPIKNFLTLWFFVDWTTSISGATHTTGNTDQLYYTTAGTTQGLTYLVSFTVANMTAGSFTVKIGSSSAFAQTVSANGTYNLLVVSGTGNQWLMFTPTTDFNGTILNNVSVRLSPAAVTQTSFSECFSLRDSHTCSKRLSWTNDDDAFGVPYGSLSVTNYLRVESERRNPRYPEEQENYVNSSGQKEITYGASEKIWTLLIGEQPEYIHDALRLAKIHDHFYIDGTEYVCMDGDYEPEWKDYPRLNLARSRFEIRKKTENNINKKC